MASFETLSSLVQPVESWAQQLPGKLKYPARTAVKKRGGIPEKISIKFKRYLVFVEKGAGRGHGGEKGGSWINAKGERVRTNPNSLGKMNSGFRRADPWFNPVIKVEVPKLAEEIAKTTADASLSEVGKWLIK